jgi:type IV pilus assembly protein PilY1
MNSPFLRTPFSWCGAVSLTLLLGLASMAPSHAQTLLADKPIAAGADVPGNMALALSVEFPTAISIANSGNYVDSTQYVGYFDPLKCYIYTYVTAAPTTSYFAPNSAGAGGNGHDCHGTAGQWSGNFMNWAATQTIDPFRWALTGGYRAPGGDTATQTILEKAWMPGSLGTAAANYPNRGTSQSATPAATANNLSTSGSLIQNLTPFSSWSKFDLAIFGNGNAMVFSGDGATATYTTPVASAIDLTSVTAANGAPAHPYRVYVRVAVCVTGKLEPNCVQYGSNYKPEGLIQQYANKIRFSAFGYLNQNGDVRQGGVMRAPMRFVGPNIPQPLSTALQVNPNPEWSSTDGTMFTNPDTASATGSGVSNSGVMNYLNKFGEASQTYKTFDNVSELYYAAVRYFENLPNVPEWSNKGTLTTAQYTTALDGFPALGTWPTDLPSTSNLNPGASILYSCQKNFILGIGDDHTWYDYNVGGNTGAGHYSPTGLTRTVPALVAADAPNPSNLNAFYNQAATWTVDLQTLEGIPLNPKWALGLTDATYFIAGLAYGVHVNDIRPDLPDAQTISTYWMDVAEGQHLENLNPYYLAAKYGGFNAGTIGQGPPGVAPDPVNAPTVLNPPAYDMLNTPIVTSQFDTTTNGMINTCSPLSTSPACVPMNGTNHLLPDNYYNAGNAAAMVASLKSAFVSISSAVTQESTSFSFSLPNVSSGTQSFGASYDGNGWTGTVSGFTLTFDATTGNPIQTLVWSTLSTLQTQLSGTGWQSTGRRIATWNGTTGVPFEFASLTTGQQAALRPSYGTSMNATTDETNYLNYLRGDRTNEVASAVSGSTHAFRNRTLLLGDIVDAGLTPVSTPQQTFSDANNPGYNAFKGFWAPAPPAAPVRPTMVYAGSNDGMLHAFNGTTGVEQFAYVPSFLFLGPNNTPQVDGLAQLGNPGYVHHNYVDATPAAFDVDMSRTVGFTGTVDYTTIGSTPWRTILVGGLGKGGKGYYALDITDPRNATMGTEAAVASKVLWEFSDPTMGYSYGVPVVVKTAKYGWVVILTSGYDNPDMFGYLYIVNPRTGLLLEPPIKTPSQAIGMTQASAFVKDFSDETADSVYVGDLQGQMWRFNLTGTTGTYPAPVLLATATASSGGAPQPITTAPLIEIHPVTRKRYVLFGTGELLSVIDVPSTQEQSFYAIIDGTAAAFNAFTATIVRSNLTSITSAAAGQTTNGTPNVLGPTSSGWVTDLGRDIPAPPGSGIGWRVVLNPQAFNGIVTFATSLTTATNPCSPQGSSRVYAIDYATVLSVLQPTTDPANPTGPPIPVPFVTYGVAAINLRFAGANGNPEIIVGFTKGDPERVNASLTGTLATRILNWREIPTVE